jgi:hypothetical protein
MNDYIIIRRYYFCGKIYIEDMSKPFHVYLDLDVVNNDTRPTSKAPQLSFQETRTQPFLDGTADDYFVAIARFSIQTGGTLPVFMPAIDTSQSDPNLTVYKINLMYKDKIGTVAIIYTPQNSHDTVALPNGGNGQDFTGNYYYIYNYQDWITMVNKALADAHVDLCNKVRTSYPIVHRAAYLLHRDHHVALGGSFYLYDPYTALHCWTNKFLHKLEQHNNQCPGINRVRSIRDRNLHRADYDSVDQR